MGIKTELQSNNVDLQGVLNTIKNLPDIGSSVNTLSGEVIPTDNTTIVISDAIGKNNICLFIGSESTHPKTGMNFFVLGVTTIPEGLIRVYLQSSTQIYFNDEIATYDKTTGTIFLANAFYERFITSKAYSYICW